MKWDLSELWWMGLGGLIVTYFLGVIWALREMVRHWKELEKPRDEVCGPRVTSEDTTIYPCDCGVVPTHFPKCDPWCAKGYRPRRRG